MQPYSCMHLYQRTTCHPYSIFKKMKKGDLEWDILADKNRLDIQLYDYIVQLFDEQSEIMSRFHTTNINHAATFWKWDA